MAKRHWTRDWPLCIPPWSVLMWVGVKEREIVCTESASGMFPSITESFMGAQSGSSPRNIEINRRPESNP